MAPHVHSLIIFLGFALLIIFPADGAGCDITKGNWAVDMSQPFYTEANCPFWRSYSKCGAQGRSNLTFQHYTWTTLRCRLERFYPAVLATAMASKTVLIVGDSLASDFNQAFVCMANAGRVKLREFKGTLKNITLTGLEYPGKKFYILRTSSNYLVESLPSDSGSRVNRINLARVDSRWSEMAKAADVIIFQAAVWWFASPTEYYWNKKKVNNVSKRGAYSMGMATVRKYLKYIRFRGTAILLSGSPSHYDLPAGVASPGSMCQTYNLLTYRQVLKWRSGLESLDFVKFQKDITRGTSLKLIDVTTMSLMRPDGHMQNWNHRGGSLPPGARDDCLHWCGGGVPDSWVLAVYNYLLGNVAV